MNTVMIGDHAILPARVQGNYFTVDARCPHRAGALSQGTLRGITLTGRMHNSPFDLSDGHVMRWTDQTGIRLAGP